MAIRKSQVNRLLAAKKAHDDGRGTDEDLLRLVEASTGHEINEAMDRSGQPTASWARIRGPRRPR